MFNSGNRGGPLKRGGRNRYGSFDDATDRLANSGRIIEFFHLPSGGSVRFKAFITDFKDSFKSTWNTETVYGRMDPIKTFKNTERVIELAWKVPAASAYEAFANTETVSRFIRMQYPNYYVHGTPGEGSQVIPSVINGAPLFKVKFMNLIQSSVATVGADASTSGLLCALEGVSYTPVVEEGFFDGDDGTIEAAANELNPFASPSLYPKLLQVQVTMNVLHTHPLGYDQSGIPRAGMQGFPYGREHGPALGEAPSLAPPSSAGSTSPAAGPPPGTPAATAAEGAPVVRSVKEGSVRVKYIDGGLRTQKFVAGTGYVDAGKTGPEGADYDPS